ncbi:MAG: DUF924 family protein [Gammaproteobacteria bacterium]
MTADDILEFWFSEESRARWFASTPEYDRLVKDRFEATWRQACNGELDDWEETAAGALALVIVLDQFPLNMFRNQAESFSSEEQSRQVARRAIGNGFDIELADEYMAFFYLPFMHSESLADQDRSVMLFETAGLEDNLKWARSHREIIRRFGRFPHRNKILGRESTPEEIEWLNSEAGFNP